MSSPGTTAIPGCLRSRGPATCPRTGRTSTSAGDLPCSPGRGRCVRTRPGRRRRMRRCCEGADPVPLTSDVLSKRVRTRGRVAPNGHRPVEPLGLKLCERASDNTIQRKRQPRRKAGTQSHGPLFGGSRAAEGGQRWDRSSFDAFLAFSIQVNAELIVTKGSSQSRAATPRN